MAQKGFITLLWMNEKLFEQNIIMKFFAHHSKYDLKGAKVLGWVDLFPTLHR